ncbi:MAG TPA: hypothetical protein VIJ79_08185 [Acidobacteriaceae bacterium]
MRIVGAVVWLCWFALAARAQISVPAEAPPAAKAIVFHDSKYGVRFVVPAGWSFDRKDHLVSTFHMDALTAGPKALMRGVAAMNFNPFQESTLSGAWFYFSVQPHTNDGECARQAARGGTPHDAEVIGGMEFRHGHEESGGICVESRNDVYTAYHKGSCYRFDLDVGTFCGISSGAREIDERQLQAIHVRLDGILKSVVLDWGPRPAAKVEGRRQLPE